VRTAESDCYKHEGTMIYRENSRIIQAQQQTKAVEMIISHETFLRNIHLRSLEKNHDPSETGSPCVPTMGGTGMSRNIPTVNGKGDLTVDEAT